MCMKLFQVVYFGGFQCSRVQETHGGRETRGYSGRKRLIIFYSSSVFEIANGLSRLSIDSSALSKLYDLILKDVSSSSNLQISFDDTINGVSPGDFSVAAIAGISAILDHRSSTCLLLLDAVAAHSRGLGADISAFNVNDSGDGSSAKDVVSVAADLKIFLNGSKFVNRESDQPAVSGVPVVHGNQRHVHHVVFFGCGPQIWVTSVITEQSTLLIRIAGDDEFSSMLRKECPRPDQLKALFASLVSAHSEEEYVKFSHDVSSLLVMVANSFPGKPWLLSFPSKGRDFIGHTQILKDRLLSMPIQTEPSQTVSGFENLVRTFLLLLDPVKDFGDLTLY
ncbi:hypothetical protein HAX54_023743 [Datura stramonium]|uniref:Protein transport protein SEC23 n=1 Tax=Datura stramonium TaxID=4076 RepID=A0ABS8UWU0_DATST|nr:hypothetical protein [Datura stramonium]